MSRNRKVELHSVIGIGTWEDVLTILISSISVCEEKVAGVVKKGLYTPGLDEDVLSGCFHVVTGGRRRKS